jgi:hypothetical protein
MSQLDLTMGLLFRSSFTMSGHDNLHRKYRTFNLNVAILTVLIHLHNCVVHFVRSGGPFRTKDVLDRQCEFLRGDVGAMHRFTMVVNRRINR